MTPELFGPMFLPRNRRRPVPLSLLMLLVLPAAICRAGEKPAIDRLFPSGGHVGETIQVRLSGKPGDGPLRVWSESGQLQCQVDEKGDVMSVVIPQDATPGTHWLRFYNSSGATTLRPFVVGILPEMQEQEPNNTLAEAGSFEARSYVANGVLEKTGDVDVFSVSVTRGQTLVAAVQAHRVLGSPMDSVVQILDAHGTVLGQNDDDHGNDSLLAVQATQDGRCFVRIFAFPSEPNSSIQFAGGPAYVYRLMISTGPVADHTWPMAVQAGRMADVEVHGWNLPDKLTIAAPESLPRTGEAAIRIPGPFALPVMVDVVGHPSIGESESSAATSDFTSPFSITGVIARPRERDVFHVSGKKNQKLRCEVIARVRYSMLDPVLRVLADDGKVLKEVDDIDRGQPDARLDVTLPADGRCQIEVRDRFAHGGPRFFYRLQCDDVRPSVRLKVKEAEFELVSGKALEIPVTIERLDGFDRPLQIRVVGLPDACTSEPVRSEKDGETSKSVSIKVSGAAIQGFSGPIRFEAVDASESGESGASTGPWLAQYELSVPGHSMTAFWLTVIADAGH